MKKSTDFETMFEEEKARRAKFDEMVERERTKRAIEAGTALLKIYKTNKEKLPQEVVDICEKYLVGYFDYKPPKNKKLSKFQ